MKNEYLTPYLEILLVKAEVLTSSPEVPDFDEDDNELPKLDW